MYLFVLLCWFWWWKPGPRPQNRRKFLCVYSGFWVSSLIALDLIFSGSESFSELRDHQFSHAG